MVALNYTIIMAKKYIVYRMICAKNFKTWTWQLGCPEFEWLLYIVVIKPYDIQCLYDHQAFMDPS